MKKNSGPKTDVKEKKKEFIIPPSLFSQLNEYSNGGFLLVILNEAGEPELYRKFDSSIHQIGVQKWTLDYLQASDIAQSERLQEIIAINDDIELFDGEDDLENDDDDDE